MHVHVVVNLCSNWGYWTAFVSLLHIRIFQYHTHTNTHYSSPLLSIRHYWGPHTCGIFVMWPSTDRIWMPLVSFVEDKPNHCGHAVHSVNWVRMSLGMEVCLYTECTYWCATIIWRRCAGRREALVWRAIDLDRCRHRAIDLDTYRHRATDQDMCWHRAIDLDTYRHRAIELDRCRHTAIRIDGLR